jgi:LmbE family N-acetylglucosaminyl deacetylase
LFDVSVGLVCSVLFVSVICLCHVDGRRFRLPLTTSTLREVPVEVLERPWRDRGEDLHVFSKTCDVPIRRFEGMGHTHSSPDGAVEPIARRLLGIWAHPDDESYLSAGLMNRVVRAGGEVTVLSITDGELGFPDSDARDLFQRARQRRAELERAMGALGVHDVRFSHEPDGRLSALGTSRLAESIGSAIDSVEPDVIVTFGPDGTTGHPDHVAVSRAVTSAWAARGGARLLYSAATESWHREFAALHAEIGLWMGAGPAPTGVSVGELDLDIVLSLDEVEDKRAALAEHASQTSGLAGLMGEATYRRWWRRESFRAPRPSDMVNLHLGDAGTVAA